MSGAKITEPHDDRDDLVKEYFEARRKIRGPSGTKITLGPGLHDAEIIVGETDLVKEGTVRSVEVRGAFNELPVAHVEVLVNHLEVHGARVVIPEEALRKLAEWAGFDLVKREP